MKKQTEINLTDLNQLRSSGKLSLELYFIQSLIFLCQKRIVKVIEQSKDHSFTNRDLFLVNIGSEFFSYNSETEVAQFTHCLSEKTQTVELKNFIELTLGDKIANQKSIKKNIRTKTSATFIPHNKDLKAVPTESKYLNFIPVYKTDTPLVEKNDKLEDVFIVAELQDQIELFDRVYEQAKIYITDKKNNSKRWHWGKANASGAT
ncbi:hypothetical protein DSM03_103184 [Leeuwenhoekiella aestuarii]|uniref:Uncharacterized protein n=1 Tax=Leeuwenhoekiella aestuarii TaxID=2249426 RepID=A0A4Q0NWK4_9FLAO|nr:hypothetical protein [Leeuwenhoekiella aestuarii]RXG15999.1 hypothetical protein DSM03_103184 [Leeuwenhoekiella aestuarii]RXG16693.1 hypothetical protein DSM04_102274 [Leeuwenhoekiella aestuarii]